MDRHEPPDKLDRHLRAMAQDPTRRDERVPAVIRVGFLAEGATPSDKARDFESRVAPLLDRLRANGVEIAELLWIAHSIAARIPLFALDRVAAEPEVTELISDHPRKAL